MLSSAVVVVAAAAGITIAVITVIVAVLVKLRTVDVAAVPQQVRNTQIRR